MKKQKTLIGVFIHKTAIEYALIWTSMLIASNGGMYRIFNNILNEPIARTVSITYMLFIAIDTFRLTINLFYLLFPVLASSEHIPGLAKKCLEEFKNS